MSTASTPSNAPSSTATIRAEQARRQAGEDRRHEMDQSLGWVSIQDLRNVFSMAIRRLETELLPDRNTPRRDDIIKHVETIQYELYKRAQRYYQDFLAKGGTKMPGKTEDAPVDSREQHQKRQADIRGRG